MKKIITTERGNKYNIETGEFSTTFCWNCGGGDSGECHKLECDCKDGRFMMTMSWKVSEDDRIKINEEIRTKDL